MADPITIVRYRGRTIPLRDSEITFLRELTRDTTYAEIAKRMYKSLRTIEDLRTSLVKKLYVRSRTGLALWAVKTGLVTPKQIQLVHKKAHRK